MDGFVSGKLGYRLLLLIAPAPANFSLERTMNILLAGPRGFCAGVNMAIETLETAIRAARRRNSTAAARGPVR